MVQVGNVAGTITVTLQLTAAGVNVTPASVVPITIVIAPAAPTITALSFSASGNTLTVLVTGFSTTREIQSATFSFTPASGASLNQKTITVTATSLFRPGTPPQVRRSTAAPLPTPSSSHFQEMPPRWAASARL